MCRRIGTNDAYFFEFGGKTLHNTVVVMYSERLHSVKVARMSLPFRLFVGVVAQTSKLWNAFRICEVQTLS